MKLASQVALTTAGVLLSLETLTLQPAQAVTFGLDWTGQFGGYSVKGLFSYDKNNIPEDGVIRKEHLTSFDVGFYNPDGSLITEFIDNHLTYPEFNFNFDTKTKTVLQDGRYNSPTGIDIGFSKNVSGFPKGSIVTGVPEGIAFWTSGPFPSLGIHVHLSGYGDEFSQLPITFHGLMDFLDISLYTLTQQEALEAVGQDGSSADNVQLGQTLQAVSIPESSSGLGIILFGLGFGLSQKMAWFKNR
ncbi:MAG: PEP-CTERM sorting domain-containing protein [Crocosphaera sp.]|nr:PEP-CTERM sorting domain-containing protein [Crocosphaera sp.]